MRVFHIKILFIAFIVLSIAGCQAQNSEEKIENVIEIESPIPAAETIKDFLPSILNEKVALVVNAASITSDEHLVDALRSKGVQIVKIFAPEHGFRGDADAGAIVKDGFDQRSGLPIISLYGANKKPTSEQLEGVETIVFDIQDVGVRFYTYISTLHYVMEAAAEMNIKVVVLDRPNPNGHYIDGPICEEKYSSFIGMHPVPVVYGMTIGEYAQMINGEGWLKNGAMCDLEIVKCRNYSHQSAYSLTVRPSPNLPNDLSIQLYPSLCFFEGTIVSVGRGTEKQFQVIGHPKLTSDEYSYTFTPQPNFGSKYPKLQGKKCRGRDFSNISVVEAKSVARLQIDVLIDAYQELSSDLFFLENGFFDKLAGTDVLRKMIIEGKTSAEIRKSWEGDLNEFKITRSKYLLYD